MPISGGRDVSTTATTDVILPLGVVDATPTGMHLYSVSGPFAAPRTIAFLCGTRGGWPAVPPFSWLSLRSPTQPYTRVVESCVVRTLQDRGMEVIVALVAVGLSPGLQWHTNGNKTVSGFTVRACPSLCLDASIVFNTPKTWQKSWGNYVKIGTDEVNQVTRCRMLVIEYEAVAVIARNSGAQTVWTGSATNLLVLDLASNMITYLRPGLLSESPSILYFDVSGNSMPTIGEIWGMSVPFLLNLSYLNVSRGVWFESRAFLTASHSHRQVMCQALCTTALTAQLSTCAETLCGPQTSITVDTFCWTGIRSIVMRQAGSAGVKIRSLLITQTVWLVVGSTAAQFQNSDPSATS